MYHDIYKIKGYIILVIHSDTLTNFLSILTSNKMLIHIFSEEYILIWSYL